MIAESGLTDPFHLSEYICYDLTVNVTNYFGASNSW